MTEPNVPILYPQRLKKNKLDKQFTKFMDVFKKLHINIPFADIQFSASFIGSEKKIYKVIEESASTEIIHLCKKKIYYYITFLINTFHLHNI